VLGRTNNQVLVVGLTQEQRHARTTFERAFARSEVNEPTHVISPSNKISFEDRIAPINS
jgi:hypothetical protein